MYPSRADATAEKGCSNSWSNLPVRKYPPWLLTTKSPNRLVEMPYPNNEYSVIKQLRSCHVLETYFDKVDFPVPETPDIITSSDDFNIDL